MHMFIGQFFKRNSNFDASEVLELISRTQLFSMGDFGGTELEKFEISPKM